MTERRTGIVRYAVTGRDGRVARQNDSVYNLCICVFEYRGLAPDFVMHHLQTARATPYPPDESYADAARCRWFRVFCAF